ncbi:BamA/TamA family outer membrane protein [Pedobacter sp. GSP4]|uniref:BamA/TamA family outer membrane protein n=1 Tax=Pedobacter sp. GSP4 TaxID=3453716 RepID=UPI003EEB3B4E
MNIKTFTLSIAFFALCLTSLTAFSQQKLSTDSVWVRLIPKYDSVSNFHRKIFGENYRKEYALETKVPVIHLSDFAGGLKAVQRGGGNQSKSIRLQDKNGNEWVLRSVEKYPEVLLPPALRQTFARDIIKDNMSAQHPFSALLVPVFAEAIGAPHSSPIIGLVAADKNLGEFAADFVNTVALLEEREPIGKSDNTAKMRERLVEDNDNTINAAMLLKLKCLDVLLGDWDRHDDQWRWKALKSPKGISYMPVPRDRDQVFYRSEGKIQRYAQASWYLPMMQGYERNIQNINWFLWEGREINSRWFNELDEKQWDAVVKEFCGLMTDGLFDKALKKLPEPGYTLKKAELLKQLKVRRESLPKLMNDYYHFFNRIVDIELSNKNEVVGLTDTLGKNLLVKVFKLTKDGTTGNQLYARNFDPVVTKEIRIYLHNGNDQVVVNNAKASVRVRIIGGDGEKSYAINDSKRILLYDAKTQQYTGADANKLSKHLSADSANLAYAPKDLYKRHFIFPNLGFNNDDGLAIGLALKFINPGFRKMPYSNSQSFSFLYSFATGAFKFNYTGEWLHAIGKADFLIQSYINAPSNTQNFFGLGNETFFDESQNNISYYRARFDLYQVNAALRWRTKKSIFSIGPSYQYYRYDADENVGRFISNPGFLHSSDSATVDQDKMFAGLILKYSFDTRNNVMLPSKGVLIDVGVLGYKGVNSYSNSFGQLNPSVAVYQKLDRKGNVVLADRIGGGVTVGKPTFYQSQFLGGHGNLLGYRQFRFAGEHSIYNNLELRLKLGDFVNYVLPGQVGFMGLYDVGRVWERNEKSEVWHHGVGGGLYFAPASLTVLRLVAAYSKEGWYPYFSLNFRY